MTTFLIAALLLLLSAGALGIGYWLTGTSKLRKGCGSLPSDAKKGNSCGSGRCAGCTKKED